MESSNKSKMNIKHRCRVCMANNRAMVNIFLIKNRNIPEEIRFCSGIFINLKDNLPPYICIQCVKELSIAFEFKSKCVQSDIAFKSLSIKDEEFHDYDDGGDMCQMGIDEPKFDDESSKLLPRQSIIEITTQFKSLPVKPIKVETLSETNITKPQKLTTLGVFKKPFEAPNKAISKSLQDLHNKILTKISNHSSKNKIDSLKDINKSSKDVNNSSKDINNLTKDINNSPKDINNSLKDVNYSTKDIRYSKKDLNISSKYVNDSPGNTNKTPENPKTNITSTIKNYLENKSLQYPSHINMSNISVEFHSYSSNGIKNPVKTNNNNSNEDTKKVRRHRDYLRGVTLTDQRGLNPKGIKPLLSKFKVEIISSAKMFTKQKRQGKGRSTKCTICQMTFEDWRHLRRHRTAAHSTPRTCEICGKLFSNASSLHSHLRTHGLPKFHCDMCDYNTFDRYCLTRHVNIHSGEYKYTCDHCNREFTFKHNLRSHIRRIHLKNEVKKFVCTTCSKRFVCKNSMERHQKAHLQIRSYACDKCPSTFVHFSNYKRHMKVLHNVLLPLSKSGRKRVNRIET